VSTLAIDVLRSCLVGVDELFGKLAMPSWREQTRSILGLDDAVRMADAYKLMSRGGAPGTFHDLTISNFNRHPVTEQQEPWVNELLTTFQAIAATAADAVVLGGAHARLPMRPSDAARHLPGFPGIALDRIDRLRVIVYAMECVTCEALYLLDTAVASAAAKRWAVTRAPSMVAAGKSSQLVEMALSAADHGDTARALAAVQPAADSMGLSTVRIPYNRPRGEPNDRCGVCGADTWRPVPLRLVDRPLRLVPLSHDVVLGS
jgi:hypothetical protein